MYLFIICALFPTSINQNVSHFPGNENFPGNEIGPRIYLILSITVRPELSQGMKFGN